MAQLETQVDFWVREPFFHGLADPSRAAVLDALPEGERTVGEIAAGALLTVSNASRHLTCLKDCGLVEARPDWRHVYYRLADGVPEILEAADAFIDRVADRITACSRPEMGAQHAAN